MEDTAPKSNKKILLIIIGIGLVIIAIPASIFLLRSTSPNAPTATSTAPQQANSAPQTQDIIRTTPRPATKSTWTTGYNQYYSINFPSSWNATTNKVVGGGIESAFKPIVLENGDLLPTMHIEVFPSHPNVSIQQRINQLNVFHLYQSNITFHNLPATSLSGELFKPVLGDPTKKGVYKTYIFLEKNNYTAIISYAYYEDANAPTYEQTFQTMLDSINLTIPSSQ